MSIQHPRNGLEAQSTDRILHREAWGLTLLTSSWLKYKKEP